ncbi:uncharacterized protein H6S33_003406 [Morchella sextelata]|uniref:uncharacterized protein n=1 Tax=Morchella sextelata TaxID=1174677 RepID=UPI001D03EE59|nr:uncharacterized protein H6S33_003406 [Morchella sextelata]KAH0606572.1 hypothetical protein H6S33_003406 [Morchella sextelata]
MADIADRPVSPLYEAIRDIMAGTWPEDEYDVADSPLGHADFKSQVSLTGEVEVSPVVRNSTSTGGATDTDFESLKSDDESESEWEAEGDDTISTDIDVEPKNNSAAAAERRRSIAEDGSGADIAARIDEVLEDEVKIRPRRNTIADEFAEGFRLEIAEELNNLVQEEPELEAAAAAAATTGGNTGCNADILPPAPEADIAAAEHTALTADKPAPPAALESERHLPRLTIPPPPAPAAPIQEQQQTPPPIPSRSPSRPNTALAGYTIFPAPSASTASLHPLKPTVSALSSSRSSRFFEELDTAAATSMEEASSTQRLESGARYEELKAATPPVQAGKLRKKRRASFSCGLRLWGKGKEKKPAASGNNNARPATGKTSLGEKR